MAKPKQPTPIPGKSPITSAPGTQATSASGSKNSEDKEKAKETRTDERRQEEQEEGEVSSQDGDDGDKREQILKDKGEPLSLQQTANVIRMITETGKLPKRARIQLDALAERLESRVDEEKRTKTEMEGLKEGVDSMTRRMENLENKLEGLMTEIQKRNKRNSDDSAEHPGGFDPKSKTMQERIAQSYATAVANTALNAAKNTQGHKEAIERTELRGRQILIDGISNKATNGSTLTLEEIVVKANTALDLMGEKAGEKPAGANFVAAKQLKNGGTVLELESTKAADWIKSSEVRKVFVNHLDAEAVIRDRTTQLKAKFVPTYHRDNMEVLQRSIMTANGLLDGSVRKIRWLKNPERWNYGQTVAILVIILEGVEASRIQELIKEGVLMGGGRYEVEVLEPEPWRCAKCQLYGHAAAECKDEKDFCGTCAGIHKTSDCRNEADREKHTCINCKRVDLKDINHTAWDRRCPVFLSRKMKMVESRPEIKYKAAPSRDPETWRMRDEYSEESEKRMREKLVKTMRMVEEGEARGRERRKERRREEKKARREETEQEREPRARSKAISVNSSSEYEERRRKKDSTTTQKPRRSVSKSSSVESQSKIEDWFTTMKQSEELAKKRKARNEFIPNTPSNE